MGQTQGIWDLGYPARTGDVRFPRRALCIKFRIQLEMNSVDQRCYNRDASESSTELKARD